MSKSVLLTAGLVAGGVLITACGGGGGGGGGGSEPEPTPDPNTPVVGDDARRAVLADVATQVIEPALDAFVTRADAMAAAVAGHAANPADAAAKTAAQDAWQQAALQFQKVEVLQVGPAAMSSQPGGQDLRDLIYAYPRRLSFQIDCRALSQDEVDADTRIDAMGLGALEHLLYNSVDSDAENQCYDTGDIPSLRADYARKVADFIATQAAALDQAWDPAGGNFRAQWSQAGSGSTTYSRPQDALDALSTALFYTEKETKDRKIACPTGIGASGLSCAGNDVSRAEFVLSGISATALRNNVQTFRDVFTGLNDGRGMNDLLRGIERDDIADKLVQQLDATLAHLDTAIGSDYEGAIAAIPSNEACINASSARQGADDVRACVLHGLIKAAMDTFRTEVVAALSLATPDRAAGDND